MEEKKHFIPIAELTYKNNIGSRDLLLLYPCVAATRYPIKDGQKGGKATKGMNAILIGEGNL